jgi:hypothetical protein
MVYRRRLALGTGGSAMEKRAKGGRARRAERAEGPPRLFLSIRDHWYQVEALEVEPRDRAYRLSKDDGRRYDVMESAYGPTCDCPDFIFRRDGIDPKGCKHVRALRLYGLVSPEPAARVLASGVRGG